MYNKRNLISPEWLSGLKEMSAEAKGGRTTN